MNDRVLVVEDESMIAMLIEDLLPALGFRVEHTVSTVDAALVAIEQREIDLAVLDINLAGTPSFPVADALLAKGIPFLFTTGYGQNGLPEKYAMHPVLQKPFRMSSLEAALQAFRPAG